MDVHVEDSQERIRIALDTVRFYRGPDRGLAEDEFSEVVGVKEISIGLEELAKETFEGLVVDGRIWIKEIEIDVDEALLGWVGISGCWAV